MQNCGTKSQLTHPTHNSCYQGSGIIEKEEVKKILRVKGTGSLLGELCVLAASEASPTSLTTMEAQT